MCCRVLQQLQITIEQSLTRYRDIDASNFCEWLRRWWLPECLWSTGHRMVDAEIDNEFPRAVGLFLPERDEVAVAGRLFVFDVCLELPWSSGETEITRGGHARERRLPREQRMLVRGRHGMFVHPLL